MFYYLYEIKNNINGKIYRGVHETTSLDDGYMGSGTVIIRAIKKYGVENFTKTILEWFENSTTMYSKEEEEINKEFVLREDVYNLKLGGVGGWEYVNKNNLGWKDNKRRANQSKRMKIQWCDSEFRIHHQQISKKRWDAPGAKEKHSEQIKEKWKDPDWAAKNIEIKKEVGSRPEIKEARRKNSLEIWQRSEYKERHKEAMKKVTSDPKWLEKNKQNGLSNWQDPIKRENMLKNRPEWSDDRKKNQSKITTANNKKSWADPEIRAKRIANIRAGKLAYHERKRIEEEKKK